MVEVLVAAVLLLVAMIPMGILLTSASKGAVATRQREAALQLADSWVEILSNSQPPTNTDGSVLTSSPSTPIAPAGTQAPPSILAGTTYTVSAEYTENLVDDVGQSDLCSAGEPPSPTHPGVIQLKVEVTWNGGQQSISDSTEINYPKPGLQTEGFLAITVGNNPDSDVNGIGSGVRLAAIPVNITQTSVPPTPTDPTGAPTLSPNPYVLYPDPNGCIFVQVPVGTYDVATSQPNTNPPPAPQIPLYTGTPSFVTDSGSTTDELDNLNVTVTAETPVQLHPFDEGINANLSYGGASAVGQGVECPNGASVTCVTTGAGATGASVAWGGASTPWSSNTLSTGTSINQVACTTGSSATCVGVGNASGSGIIQSTSTGFNAAALDTVPAGVTDLTQVTCPTSDGCYAIGTNASGGVLLAGKVGSGTDQWSNVTPPGTFTSMNSINCPTASTCELSYSGPGAGIIRLDGDPAGLAPTVTSDSLPGNVTSVGTIDCPASNDCLAIATGDQSSAFDPTILTAAPAASGSSAWTDEPNFPTGSSSITRLSCTSTTCVAIGTNGLTSSTPPAPAPAVWTADLTQTTHAWNQATGFPAVNAVTSVACGVPATNDTADCTIGAVQGSNGELIDGSLTNQSWAFTPSGLPSGTTVQYFTGVACENPASGSTSAGVGSTTAGPVVLSSAAGPSGTWTNETPNSLSGATVTGIPVEITPSNPTNWTTQVAYEATPGTNPTTLPKAPNVLYPQPTGYSIAAGDCASEGTAAPGATLNTLPGGTATPTIPLALLPIQLLSSTGSPVSGATITLTSTSCPTGSDSYNLPVTDGDGMTMTSVPYGSYSYTVTIASVATAHTTVTLTLGTNSISVTNGPATDTVYPPQTVELSA